MIYAILVLISVIMAGATYCAIWKPGKNDGTCQYGQEDSDK